LVSCQRLKPYVEFSPIRILHILLPVMRSFPVGFLSIAFRLAICEHHPYLSLLQAQATLIPAAESRAYFSSPSAAILPDKVNFIQLNAHLNATARYIGDAVDVAFAADVSLDEFGFQEVRTFRNDEMMALFVKRILEARGKIVTNEGELLGLVQWYDGAKEAQSFAQLQSELEEKPWVVDGVPPTPVVDEIHASAEYQKLIAPEAEPKRSPTYEDKWSEEPDAKRNNHATIPTIRSELRNVKLSWLAKSAIWKGVSKDVVDKLMDSENPKGAILRAMLAKEQMVAKAASKTGAEIKLTQHDAEQVRTLNLVSLSQQQNEQVVMKTAVNEIMQGQGKEQAKQREEAAATTKQRKPRDRKATAATPEPEERAGVWYDKEAFKEAFSHDDIVQLGSFAGIKGRRSPVNASQIQFMVTKDSMDALANLPAPSPLYLEIESPHPLWQR